MWQVRWVGRDRGPADSVTDGRQALDTVLCDSNEACFVPYEAATRFPGRQAQIAELETAAARHVVAALRELDEVLAAGASFPSLFSREGKHSCVFPDSAVGKRVGDSLAAPARLCPAGRALEWPRKGRRGADESRAGRSVAVDPVLGAEFDRLFVDDRGECPVEEWADRCKVEGLAAAGRWEE